MDEDPRQLPELPAIAPRRGQEKLLTDDIIKDWPGCTDPEHPAKLSDGGALYMIQRAPAGQRIWRVRVKVAKIPVGLDHPAAGDDQDERDDQDQRDEQAQARPRVSEVTLGAYP